MFGFRKIEKRYYKYTFLKRVNIRIVYDSVDFPDDMLNITQSYFSKDFVRVSYGNDINLNLGVDDTDTPTASVISNDTLLLRNEDSNIIAFISKNSIHINIEVDENYNSFEKNISKITKKVINFLHSSLSVKKIKSVILQKLNIIDFVYKRNENTVNGALTAFLNNNLVSWSHIFPDESKITQNRSSIVFEENEYNLELRYGVVSSPNKEEEKGQIFIEIQSQLYKDIDITQVLPELSLINDEIFNIFDWVLNDELKTRLENGNI